MMEFYELNVKTMKKKYSKLLKELQESEEKSDDSEKISVEIVDTRDGNHAVVVEKDGKKYRLNSIYHPVEEAKKWAEQYKSKNLDINIFMFGFGNGYFVRELLKTSSGDTKIFVWEPSAQILSLALRNEDLADIVQDDRFFFYFGEKGFHDLKITVESVTSWHNLSTQIRCLHFGYDKIFSEAYDRYYEMMMRVQERVIVKRDTNAWFAHTTVVNVLKNIKYTRHSNYITELIGKIDQEVPAIVVSAGPSLDKNIELLKKAYGKAIIIATDTAVKYLERKQLPYDCIVTIDPRKPLWYFDRYPGCKNKPLFCDTQSKSEILDFHTGRKIWNSDCVYLESVYNSFGLYFPPYDSGGSVATVAVSVAAMIGLRKIILIGQDLAYDGDHTHAGGIDSHIVNEESGIAYVEGIHGELVKTRHDWNYYRLWLENFIAENSGLKMIDATEGGALIHGSEILTFEEAIETYCADKEVSFEKIMNELPETFDDNGFEPVKEEFLKLEKGFENIYKKANEGIKLANEFLDSGKSLSEKKHARIFKEIKKVNNYIMKQPGHELLDMYTFGLSVAELSDVSEITGDEYQDEINSIKSALAIYQGFSEAVDKLREILHQTLEVI